MTIRPIGKRVLVLRNPTPDQTQGGLLLVGKELPTLGKVLAIAPRAALALPNLLVGDEVTFDKWSAELRTFGEGADLLILNHDDLFVSIRND